jgi:hypothetical protein
MNINVANQYNGVLAWQAITAVNLNPPIDLRHHNNFGFTFNVTSDIAADAIFEFQAAPPSAADPCVPDVFYDIAEILSCVASWGAMPASKTEVTIPAGTKKGSICTATLPCKPDAFIHVQPVSGDTGKVEVVAILGGPR